MKKLIPIISLIIMIVAIVLGEREILSKTISLLISCTFGVIVGFTIDNLFKLSSSNNVKPGRKIYRNSPCICGSNRKYKHCCLKK